MSTILGFILFFAILVPLLIFALVAYIVRSVTGNSLTGFIIDGYGEYDIALSRVTEEIVFITEPQEAQVS